MRPHGFAGCFSEKHERYCISIQETIAERKEMSNRVKADNARIQAERSIRKPQRQGGTSRKEKSADEEPARNPMNRHHKCKACKKPFCEWRLGQSECEMCQLHKGWNKGFRTNLERAAERANETAQTAADQPTAQPKAKPTGKPASRGLYNLW